MRQVDFRNYQTERKLVFVFLFFLVFEGVFRKWIFPGLSTPFAIIRDPFAILLFFYGLKDGLIKSTFAISSLVIGLLCVITSYEMDFLPLYYGARILIIYVPMIYVVANILSIDDLYKIGRICLFISIPMTILVIFQFYTPQSSIWNRGVGGDLEGSGFGGALGYYRPSGVFSFTQGYVCFQSFVGAFLFIFLMDRNAKIVAPIRGKYTLLFIALLYLICLPVSISRTNMFQTIAIVAFVILGLIITGRELMIFGKIVIATLGIIFVLMQFDFTNLLIDVFITRFDNAQDFEGDVISGTIGNRWFGGLFRAFSLENIPLFGAGIGAGTRFAQMGKGMSAFITDEEWTRIIYESGYILGSAIIILRSAMSIDIITKTLRVVRRTKKITPLILLPVTLFTLPQGSWGNTVLLGFSVISLAFSLISLNDDFQ